jgi:serine/threonine protein kinase
LLTLPPQPFDSPQITAIAHDIFEGLKYLHERTIVSRNVSLENVLITKSGRAVLSNFGWVG